MLRLFMLIILGLSLPVWVNPLAARSPAAGPDIPEVTFAGTLRGRIQPAHFSTVQSRVTLPATFSGGPTVLTNREGATNPVTITLGSPTTPNLAHIAESWNATVSGAIAASVVWSESTLLSGTVTINPGVILTILPGVTVFGGPGAELVVNGTLIAGGTPEAPIYFTSSSASPAPGDWLGIRISKSSQDFYMAYTLVQYAENGVFFRANAEGSANLSGTIHHSTLQHNQRGLHVYVRPDASPWTFTAASHVTVTHNLIYSNTIAGMVFSTDAGGGTTLNSSLVEHNRIEENATGILITSNTWWLGHSNNHPIIRNNSLRANETYGIDIAGYGSSDGSGSDTKVLPTVENNLFDANATGLRLYLNPQGADGTQLVNPTVRYNTFRNGQTGILLEDLQAYDTLTATIETNVFYGFAGVDAGAYAIENTTGRGIVADDNYWGDDPAEWAIGATGVITGLITFNTVRTAADAPVLTHVAPGSGVAGGTVTLHGANFGEMARVYLPLIVRFD
jgi:hypothetical protein